MAADFDLDAARASRAEVEQDPFAFTLAGHRYLIPPGSAWPLDVSGLLVDGNLSAALAMLLSPEDYASFRKLATLGDLELIFSAMAGQMGLDLPNSARPLPLGSTPT